MTGVSALIITIISCSVGMCGVLCGVFYFGMNSLRNELTAVIKAEVGALRTEIAAARTEEFKQKLMATEGKRA